MPFMDIFVCGQNCGLLLLEGCLENEKEVECITWVSVKVEQYVLTGFCCSIDSHLCNDSFT